MAIETEREFGEVSRLRGTVFRYVAMAASWFGIAVLLVLLARVVVDAFGLAEADTRWYLAYLLAAVVPAVGFLVHGLRDRGFGRVALRSVAIPSAGLLLGTAVVILFVIFNPQLWFVYYTAAVLPGALVYAALRRRGDSRAGFLAGTVGLLGIGAGVLVWNSLSTYPVDWVIHVWALAVPVAVGVAVLVGERRRAALAAAGVIGGAVVAAQVLPLVVPFAPSVWVILFLAVGVPTGGYALRTVLARESGWAGLTAPLVLLGGIVLGRVLAEALGAETPDSWLDWQFLTSVPSVTPVEAGLYPAIIGSVFVIAIVAILSFVFGVGAAIYLEEYAAESGALGAATRIIRVNIANLAGVPSVVYGLLGLGVFVNLLGMNLGTVLVAALTLSLLILPITIISAQEAIRSVPDALREAAYGMGATRWQVIRTVVLPRAVPGILTGTILSLSRAIGETAPLLMIGAATTVFNPPTGFSSQVSAMPLQVFYWSFAAKSAFREEVAPAGVVVLLFALLAMNSAAIYLRNRYQREA